MGILVDEVALGQFPCECFSFSFLSLLIDRCLLLFYSCLSDAIPYRISSGQCRQNALQDLSVYEVTFEDIIKVLLKNGWKIMGKIYVRTESFGGMFCTQ